MASSNSNFLFPTFNSVFPTYFCSLHRPKTISLLTNGIHSIHRGIPHQIPTRTVLGNGNNNLKIGGLWVHLDVSVIWMTLFPTPRMHKSHFHVMVFEGRVIGRWLGWRWRYTWMDLIKRLKWSFWCILPYDDTAKRQLFISRDLDTHMMLVPDLGLLSLHSCELICAVYSSLFYHPGL